MFKPKWKNNLKNQVELRTKRLLLRSFTMNDVDDVLEYVNEQKWAEYQINIQRNPYTRSDIEILVSMFSDPTYWEKGHPDLPTTSNGSGLLQIFAIVHKGKVVGEIAVNQRSDDKPNGRVELAYAISMKYWNKGLMTEVSRKVIHWVFEMYNVNRIYAWCDPRNIGSWRVMEKSGMKREGILRRHIKENDEFRDQLYYGILRSEWENQRDLK